MALALTISIVADLLDYTAAPLLGMPIIGDVFDLIVMSMLYSITKSKVSFIMNLAEFVPFLGDFLPVYTASTIIWILRESGYDGLLIARRLLRLLSSLRAMSEVALSGSFKYSEPHLDYTKCKVL